MKKLLPTLALIGILIPNISLGVYSWTKDTDGTLSTNLVSYYALENVNDSFGANTLTNNNSVSFISGKYRNSSSLSGANSLQIHSPLTTATDNVSMFGWVNISGSSLSGAFFHNGLDINGVSDGYSLGVGNTTMDDSGNNLIGHLQNVAWIPFGCSIGTGWHYVGMERSGGTWRGYVDGSACGTTYGNAPRTPSGDFIIGSDYPLSLAPHYFTGQVDEVGIWNKVLSATEKSDLYNSGTGSFYSEPISITTPTRRIKGAGISR